MLQKLWGIQKFKSEKFFYRKNAPALLFQEDGNMIELICAGKHAYFKDNMFIIEDMENPNLKATYEIAQLQGIDIVVRIEIAWNEICKLI